VQTIHRKPWIIGFEVGSNIKYYQSETILYSLQGKEA